MTDKTTLTSFRLTDSFLPVGSYTTSYGLEQFIQTNEISDTNELKAILETYLRRLLGPGELVVLRVAHTAASNGDLDGVCEADRRLAAITLAAEFRESATRTGNRLLSLETDLRDDKLLDAYVDRVPNDAPGMYPTVVGAVTGRLGVPINEACLLHCHSFITGLLGAAQRLLSLGHTDAQRILNTLQPTMVSAVADSADRSLDELTPFAPLVDLATADHEHAERRLFMS
ncbi:urease accessory protein UreF (plasmid) [Natrinema zhouii]|uniref:urease accessory protein UreF n=1 Tax=Natrinema zhouii TaxID=1710539 RepID=UPI001CFFDB9D|nr:urease accessory protein UreF [Natrinema zhouii]UHQ98054.1 urease accessory protein UreF [Natrinema zhouii]